MGHKEGWRAEGAIVTRGATTNNTKKIKTGILAKDLYSGRIGSGGLLFWFSCKTMHDA